MNKNFQKLTFLPLSILMAAVTSTQARAAIIGTTGAVNDTFNPPPPGTSLIEGESQGNNSIFAFDEKQLVAGFDPFILDVINITSGNRVGRVDPTDSTNFSPGLLTAGVINSHILHFDPNQQNIAPGDTRTLSGGITFDEDIIGIMINSQSLDDSDFLGLDTVTYPTGILDETPSGELKNRRGLSFDPAFPNFLPEFVEIVDKRTLSVSLTARNSIDQLRVITSPDPESVSISKIPESSSVLGLLVFGTLGIGGMLSSNSKQ